MPVIIKSITESKPKAFDKALLDAVSKNGVIIDQAQHTDEHNVTHYIAKVAYYGRSQG